MLVVEKKSNGTNMSLFLSHMDAIGRLESD
jgi:hypothetical protein